MEWTGSPSRYTNQKIQSKRNKTSHIQYRTPPQSMNHVKGNISRVLRHPQGGLTSNAAPNENVNILPYLQKFCCSFPPHWPWYQNTGQKVFVFFIYHILLSLFLYEAFSTSTLEQCGEFASCFYNARELLASSLTQIAFFLV